MLTADRLTGHVLKARAGSVHTPQELLVVGIEDGRAVVSSGESREPRTLT